MLEKTQNRPRVSTLFGHTIDQTSKRCIRCGGWAAEILSSEFPHIRRDRTLATLHYLVAPKRKSYCDINNVVEGCAYDTKEEAQAILARLPDEAKELYKVWAVLTYTQCEQDS